MTARQLHERLMEAGQHGAAVAVADHLAKLDAQHASHVAELEAEVDHLKARVALLEAQLAKASMPTIEEVVAP